jgi:tetratricopeptide (TPR) repeat protein
MKLFRRFWQALVGGPLPTDSEARLDPAKEANAVYVVCSSAQCADVGELVQTMDDQEQVISCFAMADEVSQFSPQLAQLYHGRGLHCRGKAEYDDAIADCTEAIRLDPSLARAYANRAVAYGMKGEYDKATILLVDFDRWRQPREIR